MFKVASVYRFAATAGLFFGLAQSANAADLWGPRYDGSIKAHPPHMPSVGPASMPVSTPAWRPAAERVS